MQDVIKKNKTRFLVVTVTLDQGSENEDMRDIYFRPQLEKSIKKKLLHMFGTLKNPKIERIEEVERDLAISFHDFVDIALHHPYVE